MSFAARARAELEEVLERVTLHDHCCLIYGDHQEQAGAVASFIRTGLERREKCVWVVRDGERDRGSGALRDIGLDVDAALESGALEVLAGERVGIAAAPSGHGPLIVFLETALRAALHQGFSALRIAGEVAYPADAEMSVESLVTHECRLNAFLAENDCLALCQYDRRRLPAEVLLAAIRTHPLIICQGMLWENFYYVPPEELLQPSQAAREVDRLLASIPRRGQIEKELREQQKLFQTILETTHDLITLKDPSLVYRAANPAFCPYVGRTPEEVIGKSAFAVYPPEFARLMHRMDSEALESRRVLTWEGEGPHPDRKEWFLVSKIPVVSPSGEVSGLLTTMRDITKRKQAEEALRKANEELEARVQERTAELAAANQALQAEIAQRGRAMDALQVSEQRYRHLFDSANDLIFTTDLNWLITSVNKAAERIVGCRREEMVGKHAAEVLTSESTEGAPQMFQAKLGGLESTTHELPLRTRHGHTVVLECSTRVQLLEGRPVGVLGIARDITERKQTEEALRESEAALHRTSEKLRALTASLFRAQEEERRRLSRELHDDLNQKLAMLAVEAEALAQELPPTRASVHTRLKSLRDGVVALSDDVRRMAYQLHPTIIEHLGLAVALRSYCREFSRRRGVKVKFTRRDLPEAIPHEVSLCLYRVTQEGLRNVVRHSRSERATVVLSGSRSGLHLSITDFGIGFDPEAVRTEGGLGLITMEERVRLAGGTFEVRSHPARGTRLDARLPLPREGA